MKKRIVLILLLFSIISIGCVSKKVSEVPEKVPQVEEENWMDIDLVDIRTGASFKISDFAGKPVLLESFGVWCPTCTKQEQEFQKLHDEIGDSIVSISLDTDPSEDAAKVQEYLNKHGFDWYFAVSPTSLTQALVDQFGAVVVNVVSAPVVLICEDRSLRLLSRGVKSVEKLKSEILRGCDVKELEAEEELIGPGGCKGQECEQYCQNNIECQNWCNENPELCKKLLERAGHEQQVDHEQFPSRFPGGMTQAIIEPPNTVITFAKTVNLNVGQTAEEEILRAKAMGANMVTLWPARPTKEDDLSFLPSLGNIPGMINFAHQNGLQVELRGTGVSPLVKNYEKYKASAILHVAEWAKFAEKHKVYRMVPFGEVDNEFVNHPDKITEFAQEILPEMRKYYSGQIGIGITAPWRDSGFTFNGYDYLTFSAYPQNQDIIDDETDMDKWLTPKPDAARTIDNNNLALVVNWVREVADRSGVSTIHFGETGVQNIEEKDPTRVFQTVEVSKEKESEFYEKMFSQMSDKVNGVSVFYNSKVAFMSVYGDPAEEVVKEWYNKLGNS